VPPSKRAASRRVRPASGSTNEIVGRFGETQLHLVHPGPGHGIECGDKICRLAIRHVAITVDMIISKNEYHHPSPIYQTLGRHNRRYEHSKYFR
jgi:hypothetical protein